MFVGTYWTIQEPISVFRQSYSPQGARLHTQTVATTEQIIPGTTEKIWSTWNNSNCCTIVVIRSFVIGRIIE